MPAESKERTIVEATVQMIVPVPAPFVHDDLGSVRIDGEEGPVLRNEAPQHRRIQIPSARVPER
jgi:hypothetical protein